MSAGTHATTDGRGGMSCLTHGFPRLSFGTKLLGEESNKTFVKR